MDEDRKEMMLMIRRVEKHRDVEKIEIKSDRHVIIKCKPTADMGRRLL